MCLFYPHANDRTGNTTFATTPFLWTVLSTFHHYMYCLHCFLIYNFLTVVTLMIPVDGTAPLSSHLPFKWLYACVFNHRKLFVNLSCFLASHMNAVVVYSVPKIVEREHIQISYIYFNKVYFTNDFMYILPLELQWASYHTRKIAGCACSGGNAGNVLPTIDLKGNRFLAITACIAARTWSLSEKKPYQIAATRVPWRIPGSLTRGGVESVSSITGACATRNYTYLVRGPVLLCFLWCALSYHG